MRKAVATTAPASTHRYTVRIVSSSSPNRAENGMVSRKPVRIWTPVCATRSSCSSSFHFRSRRLLCLCADWTAASAGSPAGSGRVIDLFRLASPDLVHSTRGTPPQRDGATTDHQRTSTRWVGSSSRNAVLATRIPPTAGAGGSEPRIHRVGLQGEHTEHALVHPPQRLTGGEPAQRLQPERVLPRGQGALVPGVPVPQPPQVLRLGVVRAVHDAQVLPAPYLQPRLHQALATPGEVRQRFDHHALTTGSGELLPPGDRRLDRGGVPDIHPQPVGGQH